MVKNKNGGRNLKKNKLHCGWVKNDEKKLKKANVQNSQIGISLLKLKILFRKIVPMIKVV